MEAMEWFNSASVADPLENFDWNAMSSIENVFPTPEEPSTSLNALLSPPASVGYSARHGATIGSLENFDLNEMISIENALTMPTEILMPGNELPSPPASVDYAARHGATIDPSQLDPSFLLKKLHESHTYIQSLQRKYNDLFDTMNIINEKCEALQRGYGALYVEKVQADKAHRAFEEKNATLQQSWNLLLNLRNMPNQELDTLKEENVALKKQCDGYRHSFKALERDRDMYRLTYNNLCQIIDSIAVKDSERSFSINEELQKYRKITQKMNALVVRDDEADFFALDESDDEGCDLSEEDVAMEDAGEDLPAPASVPSQDNVMPSQNEIPGMINSMPDVDRWANHDDQAKLHAAVLQNAKVVRWLHDVMHVFFGKKHAIDFNDSNEATPEMLRQTCSALYYAYPKKKIMESTQSNAKYVTEFFSKFFWPTYKNINKWIYFSTTPECNIEKHDWDTIDVRILNSSDITKRFKPFWVNKQKVTAWNGQSSQINPRSARDTLKVTLKRLNEKQKKLSDLTSTHASYSSLHTEINDHIYTLSVQIARGGFHEDFTKTSAYKKAQSLVATLPKGYVPSYNKPGAPNRNVFRVNS
ncbi:MAG: hypothetical protein ABW189_04755 [Rickettsiales bacterium]